MVFERARAKGSEGRKRRRSIGRVVPLAALAVSGTVAGLAVSAAASPASSKPAAKSELVVKEASSKLGTILVDSAGFTLYRYTLDKAGKVACTVANGCAAYWPPLVVGAGVTPKGSNGLRGLATVKDPDGKLQVTYKGHPLYTYVGDTKAGETKGQGFEKTWWVVAPSVKALLGAPSTSSGVPTTTKASSWG